jgi:hypothetical protein
MDPLQTRLDALEQQLHAVTRRLRWWRGLAGGLVVLAVLTWALPSGTAQEGASTGGDKEQKGLEQRVSALESLLKHLSRKGNEVTITGANLHIVNGLGSTDCFDEAQSQEIPDCPNGVGNLIVGYNESRVPAGEDIRTGSHNIVVGQLHNFSRFGGLVVGDFNTISGDFASVSGGVGNTASFLFSSVSGGQQNTASGERSWVSGGFSNTASGAFASVSGGEFNTASGGDPDTGTGGAAVVSGGFQNTASGDFAAVSGGRNRTAEGEFDWVAGSLVEDE